MAYDPGAIDATLAAALGDEPGLIAELRLAFLEGVQEHLATLSSAARQEEWDSAAMRMKGLAASFGAVRLMALATEATACAAGHREMVRRIERAVSRL
ncbi:Hpt domain-containing protein [Stakelama saccharophila]|uniref:Hpt domain-containing protein n=1 Tax=Stakelama saccharophila TaxID=3075605 RepID=A0ABZ0BC58_9SPHN|nr:Hpt domain-containing protein [Stakelama sp. W311]WNO55027.1 Hpt domain-containing protein [Stakelama sp. W311]